MNIFYMAIKNLKKNFSFYSLYLLSVSFVITVFFAFTSFSVNKVMLEKFQLMVELNLCVMLFRYF